MTEDINLENLMKLAATGEPDSDAYYEETFRKMLSGQKYVWNWSASLFGYLWLVYRKAYGFSLVSSACVPLLMAAFFSATSIPFFFLVKYTTVEPYCIFLSVIWLVIGPIFFQGYMGNRFYLWSLKRKIRRGYHKAVLKSTDSLLTFLFVFFSVLVFPLALFVILSDRRKVRRVLNKI